jgi:hypothetical protein
MLVRCEFVLDNPCVYQQRIEGTDIIHKSCTIRKKPNTQVINTAARKILFGNLFF